MFNRKRLAKRKRNLEDQRIMNRVSYAVDSDLWKSSNNYLKGLKHSTSQDNKLDYIELKQYQVKKDTGKPSKIVFGKIIPLKDSNKKTNYNKKTKTLYINKKDYSKTKKISSMLNAMFE